MVGLLLVLVSVAGGVRLVSSLDDTTPVYAAARDLLPGQQVGADDLVPVPVRLGDHTAGYVDGAAPLEPGTYLLRQVEEGELVPAAALGTARQALDKSVGVPVDATAARSLAVGTVVDGAIRDVAGVDEVGLPTFARGVHPATGSNEGPGAINVDVQIGGVPVRPGDVVRGDDSGLVVVPREHVDEVVAATREVDERERAWRAELAAGTGLAAATGVDAVIRERSAAAGAPLP